LGIRERKIIWRRYREMQRIRDKRNVEKKIV